MSQSPPPPRTAAVWLLLALLLIQALGAIGGGIMLIADPHGEFSKLPVEDLAGSPFDSFLVPGMILLSVLGVFPLLAAIGLWLRKTWAWWAAGMVGCGLVIWIAVQATIIDFSWLQAAYFVMGVLIVLAALPPSVRRYCDVTA